MWSKNKLKWVRSLSSKKGRMTTGTFLAEGPKVVEELANRFSCRLLAAVPEYLDGRGARIHAEERAVLTLDELEQASALKSPQEVLAVFDLPSMMPPPIPSADHLMIALDHVQDPGNLGTIIRLADWFGIEHVVCSFDTADAYAPKVVQATMGALSRVSVHYVALPDFLSECSQKIPVYATSLQGTDIYSTPITKGGIIVMGNEGNGISNEVRQHVTQNLFIPSYPPSRPTVESLNVAVATAIVCAEFRSRLTNS